MSSKTLSYAHGTSTTPLLSSTIADLLDGAKEQFGDREALACFGARETRMSFGQLHAEAERVAAGFLALGLKPGDRVGIWSPNRLVSSFAAASAASSSNLVLAPGCRCSA